MNEHLNSNSTRQTESRSNSSEALYAGAEQRERGNNAMSASQARKCGLDTGSRGWRYVYQTH